MHMYTFTRADKCTNVCVCVYVCCLYLNMLCVLCVHHSLPQGTSMDTRTEFTFTFVTSWPTNGQISS